MLYGICNILELKPFLLSCCMVVATVGNFTGQGICSIVDSFWMVLAAKWRHPKKKTRISNQSERCSQILACVVYNDHARPWLPRSTYYNKNWKNWRAAGAERSLLLDCFLYSVLLRCGFGCWWWLVGACVKGATEPNSTTNWLKQPEARGQKTRGPGEQAPGNQGPGDQGTRRPRDQGTKRTRRPGDQENQETKSPRDQGTKRTRGPIEPGDQGLRSP